MQHLKVLHSIPEGVGRHGESVLECNSFGCCIEKLRKATPDGIALQTGKGRTHMESDPLNVDFGYSMISFPTSPSPLDGERVGVRGELKTTR